MKKLIGICLLASVSLCLLSCGKGAVGASDSIENNTLVYSVTTEPDHLDPFLATSADSRFMLFNIFEGLFKPSPDGSLAPGLAESYEVSDDFRTYTIHLRNALFHNGEQVTADDVVYSLNRSREYSAAGMAALEDVRAVDERTVELSLASPDSEFPYNLMTAIVPANYGEQNTHPVGTGPFSFESFKPQQELVLVKNPSYWQEGLPKIERLIFKVKSDFRTALLDLEAGTTNAGFFDTASASQADTSRFDIVYDNSNSVQMLALNNSFAPLSDVRVRQALSYAINADDIISLAHNGHAVRAASPVIPGLSLFYNADLNSAYKTDIERARALLAEAGYADGFQLTITVPSSYRQHLDAAQIIVNSLSQIGISAEIQSVDWATWLSDVYKNRNYEATVISVDGATLSPRSYLARYVSTNQSNFFNYSNADYDRLYDQALSAKTEEERISLYKDMQAFLSQDAANVFLCDMSVPKIFKKGIKGYISYPLYIFDASPLYVENE